MAATHWSAGCEYNNVMTEITRPYTTRSDFPELLPSKKTQYCWDCHAPGAYKIEDKLVQYGCNDCSTISDRVLIHDPNMQSYFDEQDRLVHEGCGMFMISPEGKLLLFKRRKYPYLLTIPAGHLEQGEQPGPAAIRETEEEVGIKVTSILPVFSGAIEGDSCLGGADIHSWDAFATVIPKNSKPRLDGEGSAWGWYSPSALTASNTVQPVLYMLQQTAVKQALGIA